MTSRKFIYLLLSIILIVVAYLYFKTDVFKKNLSPKDTVEFKINDLELEVFYNRPSKRNRLIFGGLIPFDQVWRTGANEATTFETSKLITIQGTPIKPGKYTLWTIPMETSWDVIINSKQYPWGVDEAMNPLREPEFDVLKVNVPILELNEPVEQFTIGFDNSTNKLFLTMAWDQVKIALPIQY